MIKAFLLLLGFSFVGSPAVAEVHVFVENRGGLALINYECTSGELVRAFALDVTVDRGQILGVINFFRGPSTPETRGYGIFPAAFRDHIVVTNGWSVNWEVAEYTPLAVIADAPTDTQPGLGSSGVTLAFGALWDSGALSAVPDSTGTLCALQISEPAVVSISPNLSRGGVVSAFPEDIIVPVFSAAKVDQEATITSMSVTNGLVTITFAGGELQTADSPGGPWTGTGNTNGTYEEILGPENTRFFRVLQQ